MKTIFKITSVISIGGWAGAYGSAYAIAAMLPLTINVGGM